MALVTPPAVKSWDAWVAGCQESRAKQQYDLDSKSGSGAQKGARKDIFHWLWAAKDPETGKGYSLPELHAECELLTIAGSDTTATVISALLFYLARDRNLQNRLIKEISRTFSSYDEIKAGHKLQSCQYLTAVIHEGLRMAPPVGADMSREVLDGGTTIDGKYYPKGTLVATAVWAMHYNTDHYAEPLKFLPERWIAGEAGSTDASVALAESAFCAFSTGPRGCIGKNMAWLEMRVVLAKLVWKFEVRQHAHNNLGGGSPEREWGRGREDQYQTYDIYVADRKGPLVQLKRRLH
jgi:cytochrome P450